MDMIYIYIIYISGIVIYFNGKHIRIATIIIIAIDTYDVFESLMIFV